MLKNLIFYLFSHDQFDILSIIQIFMVEFEHTDPDFLLSDHAIGVTIFIYTIGPDFFIQTAISFILR